jgi:glycerol-3-phosphate dehydrogenase
MTPREAWLARLRARRFDVLVIGGGIVGAGIARDAAMRGLSVALIEQGDFASGTSSKTSKLIHGGLRYLEHGRLRLVFESLRERAVLRDIAPSLVQPLSLLLPAFQGDARAPWTINVGLWLYDLLTSGGRLRGGRRAGAAAWQRHRMLSARKTLALEPGLRVDGLRAAGLYVDCQMDDARLCLANILQAVSFGAVCANYVRLRAFLKADGRLCGAAAEDALSGATCEIRARAVVNAAGPWSDRLRRLSDPAADARLSPTKGIHLLLPRVAREALFVQQRQDRRMLFILPWGDYSLVGTTERLIRGPLEQLAADAEEVEYLLEAVNRVLPGRRLDEREVIATFAGARPLLAFAGSSSTASREHLIEVDRWGLVSVLGGKFTTYRRMAEQTVDFLTARHRWRADRCLTDQVGLLETVPSESLSCWGQLTRVVDPERLGRLLARYGSAAVPILQLIAEDPTLAQPVCPHHETIAAELAHAVTREFACTITDVMARRTRLAWSSCQGLDALSTVTRVFDRYTDLPLARIAQLVDEYHQFLARGLAFRRRPPSFQEPVEGAIASVP